MERAIIPTSANVSGIDPFLAAKRMSFGYERPSLRTARHYGKAPGRF